MVLAVGLSAGCTTDPRKATRKVDDAVATALGIPVAELAAAGVRSDPGSMPIPCLDACPTAQVELPARGGDRADWLPLPVLERLVAAGYAVEATQEPFGAPSPGPAGTDDVAACRRVLPAGGSCTLRKQVLIRLQVYGDTFGIRADGG
ncbi:hypothetical protein GCM10007977_065840 [Dactylosporangium sucinum]|uniref:Uncharacterized protein n=1 Tax=Dactylosporangium sucinum TaxID=1424081 RepID=A0A917U500_9ACTN|nr:hypothetical protein GCM10007977_065840 [Dactylosporangium sucinum]